MIRQSMLLPVRRFTAIALTILLCGATSVSSAVAADVPTSAVTAPATPSAIATRTLANGLKIVVNEDHATSVVQTGVWYRFGASDEVRGKTGLAHALEHMMFRGTPSVSEGALDDIAARLGAEENANTSNDYTHFYFVMPADKLDLALRLEADRMQHLLLREADWKLERGAVLAEFDGDVGQPLTKLYTNVCKAATAARICALSALGERADIVKATAADLRAYYDRYYAPNNATVVITGDVDAATAFAAAERAFGGIPTKTIASTRLPTAVYAKGKTVTVTGDAPYETVDIAYPAPGTEDTDSGAMQVVDGVINNQRSAFYQALVVRNIVLGYSTSLDQNVHDGLYHVFLAVSPGHTAAQAIAAFQKTLQQTMHDGFPADIIAAVKTSVGTQAIYARDSITGLGDRVGYALGVEGIADPAQDDARVTEATDAQITSAARRYLATAAVTGTLMPMRAKPGSAGATPGSGISDDFSKRAPSGPIIEAPWVKAALAAPSVMHSKIAPTKFTLANGLRLYVQEVHTNPTVFVSGRIEASPRFDPPGKSGTGSMATSLLSYGSAQYDFDAQCKVTDAIGASIELGGAFSAHGLAKDLGTLLSVLADGERHPTFPANYVALTRKQLLAAIARREQDPDYRTSRTFARLLLAKTDPALREPTTASVQSITPSDLHQYVARNLRPELTTLVVAGDVDPQAVRAQVESAFGSWSGTGTAPNPASVPIPLKQPAVAYVSAGRSQVMVRLGQPAPSRRNPDFYALSLMNAILGGGGTFDTRLMNEIREKRGLVYGVSSALEVDKYRGSLTFGLSANPKNVQPAVSLLKYELRRIQTQPVSDAELKRAKSKIVGGALVNEESTDVVVARALNIGTNGLPTDYYAHLASRYESLTARDILRVARKYVKPDHLVGVYEGP